MAALAAELTKRGHDVTVAHLASVRPAGRERRGRRAGHFACPSSSGAIWPWQTFPSMAAYLPMGLLRGLRLGRNRAFDVITRTSWCRPDRSVTGCRAGLQIPNVLSVHGGDLYDPSKPTSPHRHGLPARADPRNAGARRHGSRAIPRHPRKRCTDLRRESAGGARAARHRTPSGASSRASLRIRHSGRRVRHGDRRAHGAAKGDAQLIQVLAAALGDDIYLAIIGDGPQSEPVMRAAFEAGVAHRVKMLGHRPPSGRSMQRSA